MPNQYNDDYASRYLSADEEGKERLIKEPKKRKADWERYRTIQSQQAGSQPWNVYESLGIVEKRDASSRESAAQSLMRRFTKGWLFGQEGLLTGEYQREILEALGQDPAYYMEPPMQQTELPYWGAGAEMAGSILGAGKGAAIAEKGILGAKALETAVKKSPRLARFLTGTGLGALEGGAYEALQGGSAEDILTGAALSGGFSGGLTGLQHGVPATTGYLGRKLFGPKGKPQVDNQPFAPKTYIEDPGVDQAAINAMRQEGIEVPALVASKSPATYYATTKALQHLTTMPWLAAQKQRIETGFREWGDRIVNKMNPNAMVERNIDTGAFFQKQFGDYQTTLKNHAQAIYTKLFDRKGLGKELINGDELGRQLRALFIKRFGTPNPEKAGTLRKIRNFRKMLEGRTEVEGYYGSPTTSGPGIAPHPTPSPKLNEWKEELAESVRLTKEGNRLQKRITSPVRRKLDAKIAGLRKQIADAEARVTPAGVRKDERRPHKYGKPTTYQEAWSEIQDWWPDKVRGPEDVAARDAYLLVKDFMKQTAKETDELKRTTGENSHVASSLAQADGFWGMLADSSKHPIGKILLETKPDNIVRELTKDVTTLRQVREFFGETGGPEMIVKLAQRKIGTMLKKASKDGGLSSKGLRAQINNLGGDDFGLDGAYMEELFRDTPEVLKNLRLLDNALDAYDPVLKAYGGGGVEALSGGQVERVNPQLLITQPTSALRLIVSFAMGKKVGRRLTEEPSRNIFLGGSAPPQLEGTMASFFDTIRRTEATTGGLNQLLGTDNDAE